MTNTRLAVATFSTVLLHAASGSILAADNTNGIEAIDARFHKVMLATNTADPMELALAPDGRVIFIERIGTIKIWKPETQSVVGAGTLPVFYHRNGEKNVSWEDGLIGVTLDPGFATNRWIYFYHSPTNVNASENRVSRFVLDGDRVALDSEKVLLRVPIDRDVCCHAAGSLAFDGAGNLFVSTGDNTNPFESDGFSPTDDRPGRRGFDAARTSANTADLRGKILRIHPETDGSYTIPKGNLFPPGTPKTQPEIFVMGNRNPFRISVDRVTSTLSWGEVGPDAREPKADRGPAGFDEINRTRVAGNFGWPFFIGDNKAYRRYGFASKQSGDAFEPAHPENLSANNTGLKELPPAQPAWIWYPYSPSTKFPVLGSGGRTACAGPIYRFDEKLKSPHKLPREFDNVLFIYEWERSAIFAVKLDAQGNRSSIRRFLPQISFKRPIEMELGPDGCLYLIEFGTAWEGNRDSQVARLEYTE